MKKRHEGNKRIIWIAATSFRMVLEIIIAGRELHLQFGKKSELIKGQQNSKMQKKTDY